MKMVKDTKDRHVNFVSVYIMRRRHHLVSVSVH